MIKGIGTDIIEVVRIERQLYKDPEFKNSLFTPNEIKYCESKKDWAQHFSGRYASKEAFFKAIGTGWRDGMKYTEIDVINNKLGKPEITLYGKTLEYCNRLGINNINVSISHVEKYAIAYVTAERLELTEYD